MTITLPWYLIVIVIVGAYVAIGAWLCFRVFGLKMDDDVSGVATGFWPVAVVLVALWGAVKQFWTMYIETGKKKGKKFR